MQEEDSVNTLTVQTAGPGPYGPGRLAWKPNWPEARAHHIAWWKREGLVLGMWGAPLGARPWENGVDLPAPGLVEGYADGGARAARNHQALARCAFPADVLPLSNADIGPGSLALVLGCEAGFSPETVWFEPIWKDVAEPEALSPLRFDPNARWWRVHEETLRAAAELGRGKYLAACPDLVENLDILCALRDPQTALLDMIERPDWVKRTIHDINQAWFAVYDRIYEIIKDPEGGAAFGAFCLWGPGKTAKVQCDAAAMISPAMFREFVVPALTEQCEWLDYAVFHLDGPQCLCHLDALLEIEALDAIEWTPLAANEGGRPRWHDLYRRILAAGKSVQVLSPVEDIIPLLDAIGGKGVHILTHFRDPAQAEAVAQAVEPYRK